MSSRDTTRLSFRAIKGMRNFIEVRLRKNVINREDVLFGRLGAAVHQRDLDECTSIIEEIRKLRDAPVCVDDEGIAEAADDYCEAIVDAPDDAAFYEACRWLRTEEGINVVSYLLTEFADEMEDLRVLDD